MKTALLLIALVGMLGLTACKGRHVKTEGSMEVHNGSVLTLKQNLSLPTGSSPFVYFQDQQMVAADALRSRYPYCRFGLNDPKSAVRQVHPNAFVVTSVDYDERSVGATNEPVAATRMNLQTELGEKGYHMTCMLPASAGYARFINVPEIQGAIGQFFIFNPGN